MNTQNAAPTPPAVGRPPRRLRVSFACNDPNNGNFTGRAHMAHLESLYCVGRHPWDAELVHDAFGRGVALTVDDAIAVLRLVEPDAQLRGALTRAALCARSARVGRNSQRSPDETE